VGALSGPVVHEEERHRARAVLVAFEGAGDVVARQVTGVHVVHGSRCLLVSGCRWLRGVTCHRTAAGVTHPPPGPGGCWFTSESSGGVVASANEWCSWVTVHRPP